MGAAEESTSGNDRANGPSRTNSDYLVIFHLTSNGLNGDLLGSDEEDVALVNYLVLDARSNKVRLTRREAGAMGFYQWRRCSPRERDTRYLLRVGEHDEQALQHDIN